MDATHLATLRAVRDRGGVTAAAGALHLTPSAVSQQLRALRRDAGVDLLEHVGRGVRLTAAGAALADAALDVEVALVRAQAACDAFLASPAGVVRVAAFQSAAELLLPGLLTRVLGLPGVAVEVGDEDVPLDAFAALTADFDIVVAHRPEGTDAWPPSVMVVPLLQEPLDVALPVGHPLAGRERLRPEDLVDEPWIAVREGFPLAAVVDAVAARAGASPRIVLRINDFRVVEALVAAGHGISLLPRFTAAHPRERGFRLVPLDGFSASRRTDALLRPDHAARAVVQRVLEELRAEARTVEEGTPGSVERGMPR